MIVIKPLLVSKGTKSYTQVFTCVGIFVHAVNLQNKNGELLTLHCYGKGISPFGWLLRAKDFEYIKNNLVIGDEVVFSSDQLLHPRFFISRLARTISCQVAADCSHDSVHISSTLLKNILMHYPGETGLFGALSRIVASPISGELLEMQQLYVRWLQSEVIDWRPYIGKGSGLTPSHDDTMIGMLFTSFLDARVQTISPSHAFFSESIVQELPRLTTYVSVAYYQFALKEEFSLAFLHLAKALQAHHLHKVERAIEKIAQLGHTSGLDTLLGIWLAAHALDTCKIQ